MKCLFDSLDRFTFKRDDIARVDDFTVKDFRFIIIFRFTNISLIFHECLLPPLFHNLQ